MGATGRWLLLLSYIHVSVCVCVWTVKFQRFFIYFYIITFSILTFFTMARRKIRKYFFMQVAKA